MTNLEDYYREHKQKHINQVAYYLKTDKGGAEDVVQTAFECAIRYKRVLDAADASGPDGFSRYFTRIVFACLSAFMKDKDGVVKEDILTHPNLPCPDEDIVIEHLETIHHLLDSFNNQRHRQAVVLHLLMGYTNREVGQMTGLSENAIWKVVFNFRRLLREDWKIDV